MENKAKVDERSEINDIRPPADFKGITFSKYKKTEVKTALQDSIIKGKFEGEDLKSYPLYVELQKFSRPDKSEY
jgi:hypothetical protein